MRLTLLGDSTIDNASYIADGAPDVAAQIAAALPGVTVVSRAVDGATAEDIRPKDIPKGSAVFLSVGGNNALGQVGQLADPKQMTFAAALTNLGRIVRDFQDHYRRLLSQIDTPHLLVATIYNPNFEGDEAMLQAPAEAALMAYNDVIQSAAAERGADCLDLRRLFSSPEAYANPIEPSVLGGEKIAAAVADWLETVAPQPSR